MRIFVTGASGFVGSAIVPELLAAGHQVLGLARSDASAARIRAMGAEVHRGSLDDPDSLRRGAEAADGVIHTAFNHDDFANMTPAGETDLRAIGAMGDALSGSGRPLVVTSGIAIVARDGLVTEADMPDAASTISHRSASEHATVALAARGVRAMLLRLPPSVHDAGDHGFVPALIGIARQTGVSGHVGDGANRWPAVHRRDAARLYRLALEAGRAGAVYHAVDDEGVPTREIAAVIGRRLGLPVEPREAAHFGWLGAFFSRDCAASSARTRAALGWTPEGPGLLADLDGPAYFGA